MTKKKPERPKLDLHSLLESLKLPGINTQELIESRRKDIEALLSANERVFVGMEALSHKQTQLLVDIMREWQASAKDVVAKSSGVEKLNQATAHGQRAFAHALTNMKEMADIATRSHEDVVSILNQRYQEGLEEFRQTMRKKAESN